MKKGVMPLAVILSAAIILIFAAFLVYIFLGPNGILRQAGDVDVTTTIGILPQDVPRGTQVIAPEKVTTAFDNFVKLGDKKNAPCIEKFVWDDLKDFQIEMQIDETGTLFLLRNKDQQLVKSERIEGKKMCVVGGVLKDGEVYAWEPPKVDFDTSKDYYYKITTIKNGKATSDLGPYSGFYQEKYSLNKDNVNIAANLFYINWIQNPNDDLNFARQNKKRRFTPDYSVPEKIMVINPTKMNVLWSNAQPSKSLDKEDANWVYIVDGNVCLFGTKTGSNVAYANDCDADESLDNNCFSGEEFEIKWQESLKC